MWSRGKERGSVDDFGTFGFDVQVGNVELRDCLERRRQGLIDFLAAVRLTHGPANFTQCPEYLGSIEALAFAVFTEAHVRCVLPRADITTRCAQLIHPVPLLLRRSGVTTRTDDRKADRGERHKTPGQQAQQGHSHQQERSIEQCAQPCQA